MAIGDVVADIVAADTDIQPASGIEWMMVAFATTVGTLFDWQVYDGTNEVQLIDSDVAELGAVSGPYKPGLQLAVDNATYLRTANGVQTGYFYSGLVIG